MIWHPRQPNGWFPKLSPDGRYVLYGFWETHLADLDTGKEYEVLAPTGSRMNPAGWLDSQTFISHTEGGSANVYKVSVSDLNPVPLGVDGIANWSHAKDGHYALSRADRSVLIRDGKPFRPDISTYGAVRLAGEFTVISNRFTGRTLLFRGDQLVRELPEDNLWNVNANGDVAVGYYGEVKVYPFGGELVDGTITPWRAEGVPALVRHDGDLWLWTASDDNIVNKQMVLGRRLGEKEPIALLDFPAVSVDAVVRGGAWVIAGNSDKGALEVRTVSFGESRLDLTTLSEPQELPPAEEEEEEDMKLKAPAVTVDKWTLDELKDGRLLEFHDRENPEADYRCKVWIEDGSIYVSMANAAGSGRTGARREVKQCPATPEPSQPSGNHSTPEPRPVGWRPTREEVLHNLTADIAMTDTDGQDTEWGTWEALWWDDQKFAAFAQRYHDRGLKLVPCSLVVTNYRGVTFDYSTDIALAKARLERCYQYGLIPMLCLSMVDERGHGQTTLAVLDFILPALKDYIVAAFTGWELEVDGGPSLYTPEEHADIIMLTKHHLPDVVLGVEFGTPADREDPIIFDGRIAPEPDIYWKRQEAREIDVLMLELPYNITGDKRRVAKEVGGAVCRLQGRFDIPDRWPDGERIADDYKNNWRADYGVGVNCMLFEYAAFQRWSSDRKRELREFVERVVPVAGFGEG